MKKKNKISLWRWVSITFRGDKDSPLIPPLEGIYLVGQICYNVVERMKKMRKTSKALKTYKRQHSNFYPIWLWVLKLVWSEETYFTRVVMGS